MQPTLNPDSSMMGKDVVVLNRYAAVLASAGRDVWKVGDVVAMVSVFLPSLCSPPSQTSTLRSSPTDPNILLMKRILALPGAIVSVRPPHKAGEERFVRIPPGRCWIEGDESFHSRDSTHFGPAPLGLIKARVDYIAWPPG
ncbi:mitochondrial inner membrane protease subunit 2 [Pseudohyphozyma bogoriensis]|nr:mitochondrial inner membrane protease subunit 2 [Pseudohyphozyma bogoriensis]